MSVWALNDALKGRDATMVVLDKTEKWPIRNLKKLNKVIFSCNWNTPHNNIGRILNRLSGEIKAGYVESKPDRNKTWQRWILQNLPMQTPLLFNFPYGEEVLVHIHFELVLFQLVSTISFPPTMHFCEVPGSLCWVNST